MERHRVTLSLNTETYRKVQELLKTSPSYMPVSRLVDELLSDWVVSAELAPKVAKEADPAKRRDMLNALAVQNFLELADEIRQTLRKSDQKGGKD